MKYKYLDTCNRLTVGEEGRVPTKHFDKPYSPEDLIGDLMLDAINEGLTGYIGESASLAVYYHIEKDPHERLEILKNPRTFAEGLEKIFGFGAYYLERAVVEKLYSKVGINFEEKKDYAFADYVEEAMINHVEKAFYALVGKMPPLNGRKDKTHEKIL